MGRKIIYLAVVCLSILVTAILIFRDKNELEKPILITNNDRIFENYFVLDSISLVDSPGSMKIKNDLLYLYYIEVGGYYMYDIKRKEILQKKPINGFVRQLGFKNDDVILFISKKENGEEDARKYIITKYNEITSLYTPILETDSDFANSMGPLTNNIYYLIQKVNNVQGIKLYNLETNEELDAIEIITSLKLDNSYLLPQHEDFMYGGFVIAVSDSVLLYKNNISSMGFMYNVHTKTATPYMAFDTFGMPLPSKQDMGDGLVMYGIDDSKYRTFSLKKYKNSIITIEINMIENNLVLNCYDLKMNYQFSIDMTKTNFYPSDFEVVEENGETKILLLSSKNNKLYTIKMDNNGLFE